jgi:hypothetical protein
LQDVGKLTPPKETLVRRVSELEGSVEHDSAPRSDRERERERKMGAMDLKISTG